MTNLLLCNLILYILHCIVVIHQRISKSETFTLHSMYNSEDGCSGVWNIRLLW